MAADLNDAVEKAMSDAFRAYTGTKVGEDMWNLNMERTWAIVAPTAVAAVRAAVAEEIAQALDKYATNYPENVFPADSDSRDAIGGTAMRHAYSNAAGMAREHGKEQQ